LRVLRLGKLAAAAGALSAAVLSAGGLAVAADSEFFSDHPELVSSTEQSWGTLGFDTAAHATDKPGEALQIATQRYAKGIGHHANGVITVSLDGQYETFEAEVGLQPCPGGSVIFRILVDGQRRFESGVMRSGDAPLPARVSLAGARELRLEANDAGDGINCDMANWANARLTPSTNATLAQTVGAAVDMAPFARVVTWDPQRMDGARASRIEEFRAEDLFTETELKLSGDGNYLVPLWTNGVGCIGLQWPNRRALRALALEFGHSSQVSEANSIRVEGWFGESAWQGNWKPLEGDCVAEGRTLSFRLAAKAGMVQTSKIRWILPGLQEPLSVRLLAFTRSTWATTNLLVQLEKRRSGKSAEVIIWNGESVEKSVVQNPNSALSWPAARPLYLTVRYSRPSSFKSDPTELQFRLPTGKVSVAVEDVLANDCLYLPDHGLFVAREPPPVTLAEYKNRIAGRKTILQEVRSMPDQTLAQAMARTHHDFQNDGPLMLSLACDNAKFVVERDGAVRFQLYTNPANTEFATVIELRPRFGDAKPGTLTRTLEGGWFPIPVITKLHEGILCRQHCFVAPCDDVSASEARFNRPSICVVDFTVTNTLARPAEAFLSLNFLVGGRAKTPMSLTRNTHGWGVRSQEAELALATTDAATPLQPSVTNNVLSFVGTLEPHQAASFAVFIPAQQTNLLALPDVTKLNTATETYWKTALAAAVQIETPEPLLNNLIRSSQVRCLIAARNEGDGMRVAPWIAAMSYGPLESESHSVIRGMDFMGHADFAQHGLDFFIHRYNTNGFLTTGYTTFGTAWHLWTLGEHYQLTRDTNWLRKISPEIARAVDWIVRQTEKTREADARGEPVPEFGLMPPGVLADWNAFAYHFTMNGYYYAALRELGAALGDIGYPNSERFKRHAADLRANTLRAYAWTQARSPALTLRNGTWIPHYPSQVHSTGKLADFFPGQDAGRSWCYDVELGAHQLVPAGVLDPRSREVERMMDHMEDVQFLADGWFDYPSETNHADWFDLGGFSKVQPYYTRNCEIYALRDEVKPFIRSYFNTLAAMVNPEVLTMWEHFHHSGAWDKTHETGYFLHQTRTMLVQERGDELWLAPFITSNWLHNGQRVAVRNAPTRFGNVSYEINSHVLDGFIEATIEPPKRNPAAQIIIRLRHPDAKRIRSVTVNGKRHRAFDAAQATVAIKATASTLTVRAEY
jgi:hypothetical protein